MLESGIQLHLVPRLSQAATSELQSLEGVIASAELSDEPDRRVTPFSKGAHGIDTGALYHLLKARGQPADDRANFIWRNVAPPRVQMFMWLLTQRRIQCRTNLHRKHVLPDAICEVCNEQDETPEHIMGDCLIGRHFWQQVGLDAMLLTQMDNIHTISPPPGLPAAEFSAFIALSCWQLWKMQNAAVFRNETSSIDQSSSFMQGNG